MKGLILKDLYMAKKYCKASLFISLLLIAASFLGNNNLFLIFYPCMMFGLIPITLLAYDEQSRWLQYSETLPYTRTQIVSAKYLIGLAAQVFMLIIIGISQAIHLRLNGAFGLNEYLVLMMLLLILSLVSSSICLPFMFKLGVERGRMVYFLLIGMVCAGSIISSTVFFKEMQAQIKPNAILVIVSVLGVAIYALSWYMSVVFYKKREI